MPSDASPCIRVVIDTNLWISYLIGKCLGNLTTHIENNSVRLLFSDELFGELIEVLQRPKFRRYFSAGTVRELIELLQLRSEWVDPTEEAEACRDPKDNFLLDLASSGDADYLVTGDSDLLDMTNWGRTKIVDYNEFNRALIPS